MARQDDETLDLFTSARGADPLPGQWPDSARFPLNHDKASVEDTVLRDLSDSDRPLIISGFASLDRIVAFVAGLPASTTPRLVFGSEPFDSRSGSWTLGDHDLPREMRDYWLERGFSVLLSAPVLNCIERLRNGQVQTRYVARANWRLHAKIYVGDAAATLGSSNFTNAGLKHQLEANARFQQTGGREEKKRYRETVQIAEQIWTLGRDFNGRLIELLEALLKLADWRDALIRASLELLEGDWAGRYLRDRHLGEEAQLWPAQRQGIAQALYILKERGSVLIADATGSGKTRAGMHLIGAKMQQIVAASRLRQGKALLICPPAVVENWKDESALAQVQVDVYSHGALSHARAGTRDNLLANLRRAQLLGVDEGHNFLNMASNRTQQLLRNMADHVMLFTATPINRSAQDLLRIADMLGADNLDESTLKAFERMLGVRSIPRTLSEEEIAQLRSEIAKFTVRRTKRMLNDLIEREPEAYRDASGRPCRFPKHQPRIYRLDELRGDCVLADEIRALSGQLKGVLHFRKPIVLPASLKRRGVSEERFLAGRMRAASKLSQYMIMQSLRSSRAALLEHLRGSEAAQAVCGLKLPHKTGGNLIDRIPSIAGKPPKNKLGIELPDWLGDPEAHKAACNEDLRLLERIAELTERMSEHRERAKAAKLAELARHSDHILAFDTRPITLEVIRKHLGTMPGDFDVLVATGDAQSQRAGLLKRFAPSSQEPGKVIGLCSDSVSEGVNLQRARVVMHLDMPSVVRIAEQRVGRVDRLDSPHQRIEAWWPQDNPSFALQTDERFIERYETVDNLLGSNMPLPEEVRANSPVVTAEDAIRDFETQAGQWDGIEDAFGPVRTLIEGENALVEPEHVQAWRETEQRPVKSRVSLVASAKPWAFFCTTDTSGIPRWILLEHPDARPISDLETIARFLEQQLSPDTEDLDQVSRGAEQTMNSFIEKLSRAERDLLSRRKQRALEEMQSVLEIWLQQASQRRDQDSVDVLFPLIGMLKEPTSEHQPDWEEVAARWLDLIRPVWYQRLAEGGRNKPLLLKDIRNDVIDDQDRLLPRVIEEFTGRFPAQRPIDERIIACIVGVSIAGH
ncbi:MAG: SNF2-related protein [Wenzhouxiangella sp.]